MTAAQRIAAARTFLFVPGDRPDRFDKAYGAGADLVILDLEDAVGPGAKAQARAHVSAWLSAERPVIVRVNTVGSAHFAQDLAVASRPGVLGLMLPKATTRDLDQVRGLAPVIALIETARGVSELSAIAADPDVVRLSVGAIDLAGDLGLGADDALVDPIRLQMTVASRAAGIAAPVDGVTPNFKDEAKMAAAVARARALGFGGKLCIHPAQVALAAAGFAPTQAERDWAKRIVEADEAAAGGAVQVDGEMVDKPVADRARRILGL